MVKFGLLLLLLVHPTTAQYEVVGQLSAKIRSRFNAVRLESIDGKFTGQTYVGPDGRFRLNKIPEGLYFVTVHLGRSREVRQTVSVLPAFADGKGRIAFKVDVDKAVVRPQANKTSVASLLIPQKARTQLRKAFEARGDFDRAQKHLEAALELAPNFEEALNNLGTIYFRRKNYTRATELFERALKTNADSFAARVNLGGALLSLGQFERAAVENAKAVALRPSDSLARAQLGLSFFYLGRHDEALPHLQLAKQGDPMSPAMPGLFIAMIQDRAGDRSGAIAEYEEFLRLHPGHPATGTIQLKLIALRSPVKKP